MGKQHVVYPHHGESVVTGRNKPLMDAAIQMDLDNTPSGKSGRSKLKAYTWFYSYTIFRTRKSLETKYTIDHLVLTEVRHCQLKDTKLLFWEKNNVAILTMVLATCTCAYLGKHSLLYFKWVDYAVCEQYSMQLLKMITFLGPKLRKLPQVNQKRPFVHKVHISALCIVAKN